MFYNLLSHSSNDQMSCLNLMISTTVLYVTLDITQIFTYVSVKFTLQYISETTATQSAHSGSHSSFLHSILHQFCLLVLFAVHNIHLIVVFNRVNRIFGEGYQISTIRSKKALFSRL